MRRLRPPLPPSCLRPLAAMLRVHVHVHGCKCAVLSQKHHMRGRAVFTCFTRARDMHEYTAAVSRLGSVCVRICSIHVRVICTNSGVSFELPQLLHEILVVISPYINA